MHDSVLPSLIFSPARRCDFASFAAFLQRFNAHLRTATANGMKILDFLHCGKWHEACY